MNARIQPDYLTEEAERLGAKSLCEDIGHFAAWLDQQAGGEREASSFGPISTEGLFTEVLLNPNASDDQLARAAREIRLRYLRDEQQEVNKRAWEAQEA